MVVGRRIRFTAVLVGVVLALTGFSSHGGSSSSGSSGKSKSKSSSSSGGGGCSSSKSKKKTYSGGSGSAAGATATAAATGSVAPASAEVVTCVGATPPVTTIRFTSTLNLRATFSVNLYRESATGAVIEQSVVKVTLEARETRTVDVALKDASRAAQVTNCRVDSPVRGADATAGSAAGSGAAPTTTASATPKVTPKATSKASPAPTRSR
ncbi:hypothetical protein [Streptomyces sp. NPDC059874]|uniref:hypothetical protein n=1 Tax=Streptomyces sp. NPDC059874 TaxID=3346983 RepID=UPI0036688CCD